MLVGLKINCDVVDKMKVTISDIAKWFEAHHKGVYVIGKDTKFMASAEPKPHYHIHFITDATESAVKAQKSKKLKEFQDKGIDTGGRTTKMYIPKEIKEADPLVFIAYAVKEEIIFRHEQYNTEDFDVLRKTQLEVKKLKSFHTQKEQIKKDEKKEFKDKMFDYINEHLDHYASQKYLSLTDDIHKLVMLLMIKFLKENERYGSLKKCFLEMWYLEYSVKYLGKDEEFLFNFILNK